MRSSLLAFTAIALVLSLPHTTMAAGLGGGAVSSNKLIVQGGAPVGNAMQDDQATSGIIVQGALIKGAQIKGALIKGESNKKPFPISTVRRPAAKGGCSVLPIRPPVADAPGSP